MQATIYIRKENEQFWNNLKDKSNWVNSLMESSSKVEHAVVNRETLGSSPASPAKEPVLKLDLTKGTSVATAVAQLDNRLERGACKNGHPLDKWGLRCSQKGCKYA